MQFIAREAVSVPNCLTGDRAESAFHTLATLFETDDRVISHRRANWGNFLIEDASLRFALDQLFSGRCAFCEMSSPTSVYRFRPPEDAGPTSSTPEAFASRSHLYYSWLGNSWENLYPICEGCRPIEESVFPVRGDRCALPSVEELRQVWSDTPGRWPEEIKERQLLLDPCRDKDIQSQLLALPDGRLLALRERGGLTIDHFDLNRSDLVQRRRTAFNSLFRKIERLEDSEGGWRALFDFQEQDFGGAWRTLATQIAKMMMPEGRNRSPSQEELPTYFAERMRRPRARDDLQFASTALNDDPERVLRRRPRQWRPMRGKGWPVNFEIENFKSIEHLSLTLVQSGEQNGLRTADEKVKRAPALMILGENSAGKSSVLEAIALSLAHSSAIADRYLSPPTSVMLRPELLGGDIDSNMNLASIQVAYEGGSVSLLTVGHQGPESEASPDHEHIPVFAYGAFRMFVTDGRGARRPSGIRSLFEPDYILPDPESWLVSIYGTPVFDEVARALQAIIAMEQEFDFITVRDAQCFLQIGVEGANGIQPIETPLSLVSSGFRSVLGMACDIIRGLLAGRDGHSASLTFAKAVVLIDEIETHLHPRWKMQILKGLRTALPGVMFIATTHDPLCLRGLSSEEIVVLRRSHRAMPFNGRPPIVIEKLERLPAIEAMSVEQLLTSDLFDLFTTDPEVSETSFAKIGDLLSRTQGVSGIRSDQDRAIAARAEIGRQIRSALPVGSTHIERLVQEAVETYLKKRMGASAAVLSKLRQDTRDEIVKLLGDI